MQRIKEKVSELFSDLLQINKDTFDYTVTIFLVVVLIEEIFFYSVKRFINLRLFLIIVIALGIINLLYRSYKKEKK